MYTRALIRWHFYKGIFIQAGVEDVIGYTNRMYMVGAGIRFKPSDLGRLANNMEKETKAQKAEYREYKIEPESEAVYKEYKNTKSNQTKENNTVIEHNKAVEETSQKQNTVERYEQNKSNDVKKQDKNKLNESDEFFDSLVY